MEMSVYKRGTKWHYAFAIRGVRYRGAISEARTKFQAEQAETKLRQDVFDGRYAKPSGKEDFVKFVEEVYKPWARENKRSFNSNDKYKLPIICASRCFKGKTFAQISPLIIEKYKQERRAAKLENGNYRKPSTINRELGLISKIFSLAIKYGVTYANPCSAVSFLPERNNRTRYLMDEEEPRLFAVLNGRRAHLRNLVTVAIGTGMRRGDQLNLRWEKVDFQRGVIYVPNSKTGKDYTVPMNEDVRATLLRLQFGRSRSDYVFVNRRSGKPYKDLKRSFAKACELAKIDDLHWHDLRHTFGTRLAEAGCSEATIASLMGHTDPATTRRYTHATDKAKRIAVEATRVLRFPVCHNSATTQERLPQATAVSA
jgi:integrase